MSQRAQCSASLKRRGSLSPSTCSSTWPSPWRSAPSIESTIRWRCVALDHDPVEHDRDHAVLGVEPGVLDAHRLAVLEHAPQPRLLEGLAHDLRPYLRPDAVREA